MHFIKKGDSPDFFEEEKRGLDKDPGWNNLHCKRKLREYLIAEQDERCIYCERRIDLDNSHIEHIVPQSGTPSLRFDYQNLVASCNGDQGIDNIYDPDKIDSCGHRKGGDFNASLFLNPVRETALDTFFSYDKDLCTIEARHSDDERATYTIDLLRLNNPKLNNERNYARVGIQKVLKKRPNKKELIRFLLGKKGRPFISFLRFHYSKVI